MSYPRAVRPWGVIAALLVVVCATPARAETEAETAFAEGVRKFEAGRFDEAIAGFERAYELTNNWELLFNIGITHRRRYEYTKADRALVKYVELGGDKISPERRARVDAERADILRVAGRLAVKVSVDRANVTADGKIVGQSPLDGVLLLERGPHVIGASREGYVTSSKTIEVIAGADVEVPLELVLATPEIKIVTRPLGARLTLDGKPVGAAPWSGRLAPGTHRLEARLDGHSPAFSDYVVVPGQPGEASLILLPDAVPWYKRDRVQGGFVFGAAVVAIAAVAIIGAMTPDYDERIDLP